MKNNGSSIRFGPFDADLAAGELRAMGRVVRIQEQPFQILERPGEMVTCDQLRERLWLGDSLGDFDQGLGFDTPDAVACSGATEVYTQAHAIRLRRHASPS